MENVMQNRITSNYLHHLQAIYHAVDKRGILVSQERLDDASSYINTDILKQCDMVSQHWGIRCYIGSENKPDPKLGDTINLNASSVDNTPLKQLTKMGFKIPKTSARDEEGNYVSKESLAELTLQKI